MKECLEKGSSSTTVSRDSLKDKKKIISYKCLW